MIIAGKTILVTGANRDIGRALAEEALNRDAKRVHAGTRVPLTHPGGRVTPLTLDVTSAAQIQEAAGTVSSPDILINNDAIEKEEEDIFPDPMSQSLAEGWRNSAARAA